ncbi:IS200/IS605 family transposase [Ohessyouella blattaphilus]|uniref:IS200/IS605 family transposase n=1 Tax=Ohessyouella blattaphilus TaxID=2949333 RepID=UPI003EB88F17
MITLCFYSIIIPLTQTDVKERRTYVQKEKSTLLHESALVFSSSISSCSVYNILELNEEADHLHLLFEATPAMAPTEFVNVLKTKTARFARRDYPTEVGRFYWKPYFWSSSYFVATVSEQSLSLVQKYIKNQ